MAPKQPQKLPITSGSSNPQASSPYQGMPDDFTSPFTFHNTAGGSTAYGPESAPQGPTPTAAAYPSTSISSAAGVSTHGAVSANTGGPTLIPGNNLTVASGQGAVLTATPTLAAQGNTSTSGLVSTNNPTGSSGQGPSSTTAPDADDARHLQIVDQPLHYTSVADAFSATTGRTAVQIDNDDWQEVKRDVNSRLWVKAMVDAFGEDYLDMSPNPKRQDDEATANFRRWQKKGNDTAVILFKSKKQIGLERCCWTVLDTTIKMHELGSYTTDLQLTVDTSLTCTGRLAKVVELIEQYSLIRVDILKEEVNNINHLISDPIAFIKRKIANCWNNFSRAKGNKKGGKSNRGRPAKATQDENATDESEENEVDEDAVEADVVEIVDTMDDIFKKFPVNEEEQPSNPLARYSSRSSMAQSSLVDDDTEDGSSGLARPRRKRARSPASEGNVDPAPGPRKRAYGRGNARPFARD
ncbi:hypothetical protein Q7P37_007032 [Cladosporium fusiforme]